MKRFLLLYLSFLMFVTSHSQNKLVDSLYIIVKENKQDSNQVKALNLLGNKRGWSVGNFDSALIFVTQAKDLAKKLNFKAGLAKAYTNLGNIYWFKGNYPEALNQYFVSLKIRQEMGDKAGIAGSYQGVGNVYLSQGNYPLALKQHLMALKMLEEISNKQGIATSCGTIGSIYFKQGNYPEALKKYFTALKINEELNDKQGIAYSYNNIALVYQYQGDYTEALNQFISSLKIKEEIGDKQGIAASYNNIGVVYKEQKNYDEALKKFLLSLKIKEEIGDKQGMAMSFNNIGIVYSKLKKPTEGKNWLQKGLSLSKEIGNPNIEKDSYSGLAEADSMLGNYKDAYYNYKMYVLCRDSLVNEENTKKTVQQQMQYEFDKKQTADSLQIAEERHVNELKFEHEKNQRYFLYGGLGLVALFAGFMFNRFKVTQKQKNIIELKEKETQEQNVIISKQKHLIEERHKEITDSINYAERIQRSFLATEQHLNKNLSEYFILFKPKDVVSGDFYWSATLKDNCFALATADSTGHGVPGAIMSLLNITSLEKAIETQTNPAEILNYTRKTIIERLKKDGSPDGGKDGMDCSLCVFDFKNLKLQIACANNPIWIVRETEIIEIKPDKMPVGKHDKQDTPFTLHEIQLQKGDMIYTLTDGFPDQFGGDRGKKFMSKKLRELLVANIHLPMNEQKHLLEKTFTNWIGTLEQTDDVTIIGIKV